MAVNFDENNRVIKDDLTVEEKLEYKAKVEEFFSEQVAQWFETYKWNGVTLELGGLDEASVVEALSEYDDSLVWADKNYESVSWHELDGLVVGVTGWAWVAGKFTAEREAGEDFLICEVPYTGGPKEPDDTIYHLAQMACPFCEAEGCEVCDDEGEWEFELD